MIRAQDLLNYQFHPLSATDEPTLVFIHGLFGDMNNLGVIARAFSEDFPVLRPDLRNHGHSFHAGAMNYRLMAQDLLRLIDHLNLKKVILIGHSMGGKTAMAAAALRPEQVEKLIVLDIAPVSYAKRNHDHVFTGLFAVKDSGAETRQQAKALLARYIKEEDIQQFMLKSFAPAEPEKFRFNLTALWHNYQALMDWEACCFANPTLFIKGGRSDYILPAYTETTRAQFPQGGAVTINAAGHWVHAEKPDAVIRSIKRFIG